MTEQTQPTDAELIAFATEEQFLLFCDPDEFTDIARAVLAKWGTPAGAGEPTIDTYGVFPEWLPGSSKFKDWCAKYFSGDADETYLAEAVLHLPRASEGPLKAADEFELRRLLAEERATTRQLVRALAEATEPPTFMGEPTPQPTQAQAGAVEAIAIMRIFQTNLGSCIESCDKGGRKMWKRIDAACAALEANVSRECCNEDCGWVGPQSETVHPKHDPLTLLCPKCHETTEIAPTSPTAVVVPLTPEQITELIGTPTNHRLRPLMEAVVRKVEAAHGIKGADHG